MNHSPRRQMHVRRVLHIPAVPVMKTDDPIVIRRNYDITAACGRSSDGDDGAVTMHMHLSRTTPLWRCIVIGAAVVGTAAAVIGICRARRHFLIRRKYARRYAERFKLQKQNLQMQHLQQKNLQQKKQRRQTDAACDPVQKP